MRARRHLAVIVGALGLALIGTAGNAYHLPPEPGYATGHLVGVSFNSNATIAEQSLVALRISINLSPVTGDRSSVVAGTLRCRPRSRYCAVQGEVKNAVVAYRKDAPRDVGLWDFDADVTNGPTTPCHLSGVGLMSGPTVYTLSGHYTCTDAGGVEVQRGTFILWRRGK